MKEMIESIVGNADAAERTVRGLYQIEHQFSYPDPQIEPLKVSISPLRMVVDSALPEEFVGHYMAYQQVFSMYLKDLAICRVQWQEVTRLAERQARDLDQEESDLYLELRKEGITHNEAKKEAESEYKAAKSEIEDRGSDAKAYAESITIVYNYIYGLRSSVDSYSNILSSAPDLVGPSQEKFLKDFINLSLDQGDAVDKLESGDAGLSRPRTKAKIEEL